MRRDDHGRLAAPRIALLSLTVLGSMAACSSSGGQASDGGLDLAGDGALEAATGDTRAPSDQAGDRDDPPPLPQSCGFDYDKSFTYALGPASSAPPERRAAAAEPPAPGEVDRIAHAEPPPPFVYRLSWLPWLWPAGSRTLVPVDDLTMPGYVDQSPAFARGADWSEPTRCYETPRGAEQLSEDQAYDLYRAIAEQTTGVKLETAAEVRSVVGLRGAYPGTFAWNDNLPNRFNDTLVLLWIDGAGKKHAREFPGHTDTGPHNFGYHASSSLRPNRRYRYINGWHRNYNALRIDETAYRVRDDANKNGHWDSERNGWLPPDTSEDHDRAGSAHNIHTAPMADPLGEAEVNAFSAGCQVVPGQANWIEFITNAWTKLNAKVDYFLVDVRDIAPEVWGACTPDGSHGCPHRVAALPLQQDGDTSTPGGSDHFDAYSCAESDISGVDLSGPEAVHVLTVDKTATIVATLEAGAGVGLEVLLLDADDPRSCIVTSPTRIEHELTPGRYVLIVDTRVEAGTPLAGPFTLRASWK